MIIKPRGEKHGNWKGEKAGYFAKHNRANKTFGTPMECEDCKSIIKNKKLIQWANISGKFKSERTDWRRLCIRCHKIYDYTRKHGKTNEQIKNADMTVSEFAKLGGIAKWKNVPLEMRDTLKEHLTRIGKLGGKATSKKYGKEHYQDMVKVRENKKKLYKVREKAINEAIKSGSNLIPSGKVKSA